jgi:ABC-type Na+ transport system ATPase subunit NatA
MLELIDIKKRYGSKEVLHGISIKFENGIYGLIGPNGSGKSTIMNIMSDVLDMSSGKILYNGTDIKELDDRYREKIGFLPQNVGYYPNFTAKKTIEYFGYLRGVNKKELDSNVEQVLRDVNLYENRNDKVKSFSGGMKQRLGIAITCVANPEIIIFDEPTVGLDPARTSRARRGATRPKPSRPPRATANTAPPPAVRTKAKARPPRSNRPTRKNDERVEFPGVVQPGGPASGLRGKNQGDARKPGRTAPDGAGRPGRRHPDGLRRTPGARLHGGHDAGAGKPVSSLNHGPKTASLPLALAVLPMLSAATHPARGAWLGVMSGASHFSFLSWPFCRAGLTWPPDPDVFSHPPAPSARMAL